MNGVFKNILKNMQLFIVVNCLLFLFKEMPIFPSAHLFSSNRSSLCEIITNSFAKR